MIKFSQYSKHKLAQSIIFSSDQEIFKEDRNINEIVLTQQCLMLLRNLLQKYGKDGVLTDLTKNNMYSFVQYLRTDIRYSSKEARSIILDLCNDMISILNMADDKNAAKFYRRELYKRGAEQIPLIPSILTKRFIDRHNQEYNQMIATDFELLLSHSNYFDFMKFLGAAEKFINKEGYYYSLNAILTENPSIVRNQLFYKRVKILLDNVSQMMNDRNDDDVYFRLDEGEEIPEDVKKFNVKMLKRLEDLRKRYS